jgi:hypothetical protein
MKTVNYSALNSRNKSRVDTAVSHYETKPTTVHHAVTSTHCTKFVRSMVTVCDPSVEMSLLIGGKLIITKIALDK